MNAPISPTSLFDILLWNSDVRSRSQSSLHCSERTLCAADLENDQENAFQFENMFLQINYAQFPKSSVLVDPPLTFAAEGSDEFDGERTLVSCESGSNIILSTSTFADFRFLNLPAGAGSIAGILSRDFFNDFYVFLLNTPEDINL